MFSYHFIEIEYTGSIKRQSKKCSTKSNNAVRRLKLKQKSLEDNHTLRGEDSQFETDLSKKCSSKCTSTFKYNVRKLNGKF